MANLKDIRNRISSVKSTMQITNAMKMVSAAKLKKAQEAIESMRPYADKLDELLMMLSAGMDTNEGNPYARESEAKRVLLVPVTSNRGLCGALNSNVVKETQLALAYWTGKDAQVDILTIGKRAYDILKKTGKVIQNRSDIFDRDVDYDKAMETAEFIMNAFAGKEYDRVYLIYNRFKNAAVQNVQNELYLPVQKPEAQAQANIDYIYEPSQKEIVEQLIPKSLKTRFFRTLRDAWASEHGARMTAMHKATDNAKEMAAELTLQYNKARQAVITGEILEIVSGAEALKNQG
ncbi:MAG: ATP synthase F1 subunit gamma [Chlorobi bacterium]|nr:ATP synthase F1 subunit gamma [Chlorobiota bacterium]